MNVRRARLRLVGLLVGIAASSGLIVAASSRQARPAAIERRPLAPAEALGSFVLEPGYRIDLVAAEPLVDDPVAIAFDERGGLYVVENRGYPDPLEGQPAEPPRGRIARLTDRDGDGRFDTRTEFATGLTYPNGVAVWDGGVFVTAAPDLLYLKDTDDDGVADVRRVALTGFNATRTAQIRFSHPTLGPDGWIYLTSGLNGGRVYAPDRPERPAVTFTSSDSRYHPRTGAFELVGGQGQYGLTFDDHGHRFICANRHPVWHVVFEPRHLQRNPALAFSDTVQEVSTVGAEAAVWPLTRDLTTASFHPTLLTAPHAGTFTSASGVHVHRGDALPAGHAGSVFVAESAQNLVQRQVRVDAGPTFQSRPARAGVEFLASTDSWFRPVFLANGPDGALYVVDMYRKDIDHPAYVPEDSRGLFEFTAGRGRGRIYRVAAAERAPSRLDLDLAAASPAELVSSLAHANSWWRETAQRLVVERRLTDAVPHLRALRSSWSTLARLHALWTLDALGAVTDDDLRAALRDEAAPIREQAVRLVEARVGRGTADATLVDDVVRLAADADARVRLQVALALGAVQEARAVPALASIAARDGVERWTRAAVLSGLHARAWAFLDAFAATHASAQANALVWQDVARLVAATEPPARVVTLVARLADPQRELQWQAAALSGVAEALRARGLASADRSALLTLVAGTDPPTVAARERLALQFERARVVAAMDGAPAAQRLAAIELLGHGDWETAGAALLALVAPQTPSVLQLGAVRALGQVRDTRAAAALLEAARWQAFTPRLKEAVLTALLGDARGTPAVLDAIERGQVPASAIGPSRTRRLTEHADEQVRTRARRVLGALDAQPGRQAYERWRGVVRARSGDAARGAQQFAAQCSACHTARGAGGRVGPDLSGIRNQPAEALLLHVLVPDYEITPGYEAYTVQLRDGQTLFGRLESETAGSLTLRDAAGDAHVVLRSSIATLSANPTSLMPATFHEALGPQDLADLIAFLKQP